MSSLRRLHAPCGRGLRPKIHGKAAGYAALAASGRGPRRHCAMTGFLFPVFHFLHPVIEDGALIEKILRHLELPIDPPAPTPARTSGWLPGFDRIADWITE